MEEIKTVFIPLFLDHLIYSFIEFVPIPVFIADADNRYLFINQTARDFLDLRDENIVGKKILDVFHVSEDEQTATEPKSGEERYELEFARRDGTIVWGEVISSRLPENRRQIFIYDITERKRAEQAFMLSEERLWQTQKYDALGKLAGGVAHDMNNFLAVIMLQTDLLSLQLPADNPHHRRVNEIKAVVNNAAAVVRQLLAFGRKQMMNSELVVLNRIVMEFLSRMPDLIGENIEVRLDLNAHLGACFVDSKQIEKVLFNLVLNAAEAMPAGGAIEIKTTNIVVDKNTVRHKAQPIGSYVQLSVMDDGCGMDSEIKEHLFEPFFSTKQSDKSAGLGLATVYGIVKQLKGFIWVESEANHGATFTIQFPNVEQPATLEGK